MVVLEATLGGIRKHVLDVICGLERDRFEITFVFSRSRADAVFVASLPGLAARGIRLVEIPMTREIGIGSEILALVKLIGTIRKFRPDVIHLHGAKAGALGRLAAFACGVHRVIYTPHGGAFHKVSGLKGKAILAVERTLAGLCDTLYIGVSRHSCRQIADHIKVPSKNVRLVYNGIDVSEIDRELSGSRNIRPSIDASGGRFIVLYPAVFLEAKGHVRFLEAIASSPDKLSPDILIVLAGDGPLRQIIRNKIEDLGLRDHFLMPGFILNIFDYYRACDLVILPSQAEVFGYVILEAMACSKPVLATAVGGIPELLEHKLNGELIPLPKLSNSVGILNCLAARRDLCEDYGRYGRTVASTRFSMGTMLINSRCIYEEVYSGSC